ncbi:MAG: iron-containing redox enzyme family protein, partial [Gammaproteobacteria bacterium]
MTKDPRFDVEALLATVANKPARRLYEALVRHGPRNDALEDSRDYLDARLDEAARLSCDLPDDPADLEGWMLARHESVGRQYLAYLDARRAGAPRQYFPARAHALYFLRGVAPTKMVDGAWLYGLVDTWRDDRFQGLIRTYLEELGNGLPQDNHVALYRRLLAANGCEHWHEQDDERYVQGAIQLCLAHGAPRFLPEVIGFNLGYEQLPLHLLITAYELDELGIDPYYFTVHVTVDNPGTGHGRKAVEAVWNALPKTGARAFYERVRRGYRLNDLGKGTVEVIRSFDLQAELLRILEAKSLYGCHLHSDYARVAGRTVNQWLSDPRDIPAFLGNLERSGWIKRHRDPDESRFWKLLQGDRAEMFGVFSSYELQVIHAWIAGDAAIEYTDASARRPNAAASRAGGAVRRMGAGAGAGAHRPCSFRAARRREEKQEEDGAGCAPL